MIISKANTFQYTATGLVLSASNFRALCCCCPTQVFAALSLLCVLRLFLMQGMVVYCCPLHNTSRSAWKSVCLLVCWVSQVQALVHPCFVGTVSSLPMGKAEALVSSDFLPHQSENKVAVAKPL